MTSASARQEIVEPGPTPVPAYDHGWLGAVVPASARRFRATDPGVAAVLAVAGAELVESAPDVEMAFPDGLRGDAPLGIVILQAPPHDSRRLAVRLGRRIVRSALVRVRAARARRTVERRGYANVEVLFWDVRQAVGAAGARPGRRALVEYLPQRALVVGRRGERAQTVLEECVRQAEEAIGVPLGFEAPVTRSGLVTATSDEAILRVAVGPARGQIDAQLACFEALSRLAPPPEVAALVPWPAANGVSGLASWSLERRLPAAGSAEALTPALLREAVDFLVPLHRAGRSGPSRLLREVALVVAQRRPSEHISALAGRLDAELDHVPRGFGHGDLFLGNLLLDHERHLSGVVDWDAGGPARLPLLDLVHLRHMAKYPLPDDDWGPSVARRLIPWARAGGDDVARDYCRRIGFRPEPRVLTALVAAYWLERVAYQLSMHPHRAGQERWLERNVDFVLNAIAGEVGRGARTW